MKPLTICYRGTSIANARKIKESGYFKAWTYFAKNLHNSISYGGVVFWVAFEDDGLPVGPDSWQFMIREDLPLKGNVAKIMQVNHRILEDNEDVNRDTWNSNNQYAIDCPACGRKALGGLINADHCGCL